MLISPSEIRPRKISSAFLTTVHFSIAFISKVSSTIIVENCQQSHCILYVVHLLHRCGRKVDIHEWRDPYLAPFFTNMSIMFQPPVQRVKATTQIDDLDFRLTNRVTPTSIPLTRTSLWNIYLHNRIIILVHLHLHNNHSLVSYLPHPMSQSSLKSWVSAYTLRKFWHSSPYWSREVFESQVPS